MQPKKGVIISVYVESPNDQNPNNPLMMKNKKNIIKPNAPSKTSKSKGYDRRAQLLAYSRELRNVDSSITQLPNSKSKKWKWKVKWETLTVRRLPSRRAVHRWRYERVGMMREERTEVVDQPCRPKCFCGNNNKKITPKSASSIFRKLKSLVGELSKGCKRSGD